ncbi:hypothetical protein DH2020_027104 [Rehmannia glutinosa]|uniref:Ty3 transposon capsid-like protein domain-containing protein n=1 Tax=Rehmannia glutinosa TaxID=99300 RepID=A0ABR0VXZ0_REHGL
MAEGTRMKDLQEAQKRLDQILQTESLKREATEMKLQEQIAGINSDMQDQMMGINTKYEHLTHTLAAIQLQLLNLNKGKSPMDEESILGGPFPGANSEGNQARLIPNIPDTQKVTLASMHFDGKAAQWYQSFCMKQGELSWHQFVEVVSARFEELKEARIIAEFNKLKHNGSYMDYVDKFEELKACMLLLNGEFSEEYFVASFISGLSEELQAFINMFEPTTLQETIDLGKKQIQTLEAITRKMKTPARSFTPSYTNFKKPEPLLPNPGKAQTNPVTKPPIKLLTASEMAARREKGLCYNCDEPFSFGHRCKQRINYMIMTEDEELTYLHTSQGSNDSLNPPLDQMEEIQMSLNAIAGEDGITTMRLFGESGEHKLHILIDSGSTLSFIQEATARKLGCHLEPAKPILVKVANGQRMVSSQRAANFKWVMQGQTFTYSLRLLENEGCDLILGGDWLKSCTPIELDYDNMTFTVTLKGKRVKIQAMTSMAECKLISGHSLYKMMHTELNDQIEEIYVETSS